MDEGVGAGRRFAEIRIGFSESDSSVVSAPSDGTHQPEVLALEARGGARDGADVSRLFASDDDDADVLERRGGIPQAAEMPLPRALRDAAGGVLEHGIVPLVTRRAVASARAARRRATRRGGVGRLSYDAAGTGRDGGGREDSQREHRAARVCCGNGDDTRAMCVAGVGPASASSHLRHDFAKRMAKRIWICGAGEMRTFLFGTTA